MAAKRWDELSQRQRAGIIVGGIVQFLLLLAALLDLWRRPGEQVRGSKKWWAAAAFVNFAGPLSYFVFGRRRRDLDSSPAD